MSTDFTEADVAEAVEIVTRAFCEELQERLSPLDALEIMVAAVRRIEGFAKNV